MKTRFHQVSGKFIHPTRFTGSLTWLVLTAGLLTATPTPAASVSFFLDQSNRLEDGIDYLKVTIDDNGAADAINFRIEILGALSGSAGSRLGIEKFGFNGIELGKRNIIGLPEDWKLKHDKTLDGFGKFENVLIGDASDPRRVLTFSVVGIGDDDLSTYSAVHDGGDDVFFAAYVRGLSPGDKGKTCKKCPANAYFGGGADGMTPVPTAVPVPAAAWLFGSGLLGFAGVMRRGRKSARLKRR